MLRGQTGQEFATAVGVLLALAGESITPGMRLSILFMKETARA